jgi:hypothetical protein
MNVIVSLMLEGYWFWVQEEEEEEVISMYV